MERTISSLLLFISHASEDRELAELLIELLRTALPFPAGSIRCTSVEGYGLAGGTNTDDQLRTEIGEAIAFIGIVSDASLRSAYVAFELGGRWTLKKHLIPLLAPGTSAERLVRPLAGINALRTDSASQLHQLVTELSDTLGLKAESAAVFQKRIDALLKFAAMRSGSKAVVSKASPDPQPEGLNTLDAAFSATPSAMRGMLGDALRSELLGDAARALLIAAAKSRDGSILVVGTMGGTHVDVDGTHFGTPGDARDEARWRAGIRELQMLGCIEDRSGQGKVFCVTDEGFQLADALEKL